MQVVVHERQRACQRVHFASNNTEDKFLHGLFEGGSTKNGLDQVLNVTVEIVQGGIESGSGGVDPTEDAIVDGALDAVHLGVNLINVDGGLVQHIFVQGRGDGVGEICRGRQGLVAIRFRDGTKSEELKLNTKETNEADEEARKSGRVEDVTEEPPGVNLLRSRKAKKSSDLIGDSHEKGMSSESVKGEKVVVCELDSRRGTSSGMVIDSRVGVPGLSDVLEVVLETAPLIPFERAVGKDEEEDDNDDDDRGNLSQLDNVTTEIVDDRGVNLIAETDGRLFWNGEDGFPEGNVVECASDILFCQLKGSIEAGERVRKTVVFEAITSLQSIELILDLGRGRDRTIEFDQRLGEIIGDRDVLESIKRGNTELGGGDL